MKLTVESYVAGPAVSQLYDAYLKAFLPLAAEAAALHVLDEDQFAAEMADPRIDKYIVWDEDGQPVGLTTLTADMSAVPWISGDFYSAMYPQHAATGRLFYLGYTLVVPERQQDGITGRIIAKLIRRMREVGAVAGFDVCARNDDEHHMAATMARLARLMPVVVKKVDVQSYYVADFSACLA